MLRSRTGRLRYVLRASVVSFVAVSASVEALAAGSNTTTPAVNPQTPTPVVTSQPQVAVIGSATCAQQLNTLGIVAQGVSVGTDIVGLGLEAGAQAAPTGPIQQGLEASAIGVQVVSKTASAVAYAAQIQASSLPSCEQEFTRDGQGQQRWDQCHRHFALQQQRGDHRQLGRQSKRNGESGACHSGYLCRWWSDLAG